VLRAERLEQEVIRSKSKRRLEVVRYEGHLDIVARVDAAIALRPWPETIWCRRQCEWKPGTRGSWLSLTS
jgi:hypothetical protein